MSDIDFEEAKAQMIIMRQYVMRKGIPIGDCVAWNKLKKMFGIGENSETDAAWLDIWQAKNKASKPCQS